MNYNVAQILEAAQISITVSAGQAHVYRAGVKQMCLPASASDSDITVVLRIVSDKAHSVRFARIVNEKHLVRLVKAAAYSALH